MYRRRRQRSSEIAFSFDSFLDLVANVVGIILRLILVAWMGARTYTGFFKPPEQAADTVEAVSLPPEPELSTGAEKAALDQTTKRLADARASLLEHLRQQEQLQVRRQDVQRQSSAAAGEVAERNRQASALDAAHRQTEAERGRTELTLTEIRKRCAALEKEIADLAKQPVKRQVLRYQTPLARTVQSEELHFEIQNGRVCFLDVESLMREIKSGLQAKVEQLRSRWSIPDETGSVGAFKLRYVIARERNLIDSVTSPAVPDDRADFRYGLESWEAVPLSALRGETLEEALREGSQFRRVIDRLDATQTAVTLWVYPESFAAYRQLRDYCLRRELLVAGRPLLEGLSIASSRSGTASRGQ